LARHQRADDSKCHPPRQHQSGANNRSRLGVFRRWWCRGCWTSPYARASNNHVPFKIDSHSSLLTGRTSVDWLQILFPLLNESICL